MEKIEKSIVGVFFNKFKNYVDQESISSLLWGAAELVAGITLGVFFINPGWVIGLLGNALAFRNFAFIKVVVGFLVVKNRGNFRPFFRRVAKKIKKLKWAKSGEKLIEGIPVTELVDYLIRNQNFKREGQNGARATFGLSMKNFNRLADTLEKNEILVRGEKNSRILGDSWTRQALFSILIENGDLSRSGSRWIKVFSRIGEEKIRLKKDQITTLS